MLADTYPIQVLLGTGESPPGGCHRVPRRRVSRARGTDEGEALRPNDDPRRRLAAKAKLLGRRTLNAVATIVTPDTLMRWQHRLIAAKWTYEAKKRAGRPGLMKRIKELVVRMAIESSSWGCCRIQGELKGIGHTVASTTIANFLMGRGIKPAPDQPSSWKSLLKAHWGQVAATDFFSVEVWTPKKLTDYANGFLRGHRFPILDRNPKFTKQYMGTRSAAGVETILTPVQAPNCIAYAKRFVLSIKSECLGRMIFFCEASLRRAATSYLQHDHIERACQALSNDRVEASESRTGEVQCTERQGGILEHYSRAA